MEIFPDTDHELARKLTPARRRRKRIAVFLIVLDPFLVIKSEFGTPKLTGAISLRCIAPRIQDNQYAHNGFEDNADAHMKRQIMGREVVVAVTEGRLDFGPWEQIFYSEFDGRRPKRILIKIIGE